LNYNSLVATVKNLISHFGATITLTTVMQGAYDPTLGTISEVSTDYSVVGVTEEYNSREIDGDSIKIGDKKLMISSSGLSNLNSFDSITLLIDSVTWKVIRVNTIQPGDTIIFYQLQIRVL